MQGHSQSLWVAWDMLSPHLVTLVLDTLKDSCVTSRMALRIARQAQILEALVYFFVNTQSRELPLGKDSSELTCDPGPQG